MAALRRHAQALVDRRQGRPPFAKVLKGLGTEVLTRKVVIGVADFARELEPPGGCLYGAPEIRAEALEGGEPSGALAYYKRERATGVEPATSSLGSFRGPCGARGCRRP